MMDGSKKVSCVGIIGDGCGGGREFIIEDGILFAHDPISNEDIILKSHIEMPKNISKKGCILYIECQNSSFEFDLSKIGK